MSSAFPVVAPEAADCHVMELRQYTLHPRQRDVLIELFDREFVETQEAAGLRVIGQFRDLDDADRFVWLRGFANMAVRRAALQGFYGGPVWAAHRSAANATMIDSDNVLLLRPAWAASGVDVQTIDRAAQGVSQLPSGVVSVMVFPLREPASAELIAFAREHLAAALREAGAIKQGWYVTEPAPNDYPRLPVREGEFVLVGVAVFADCARLQAVAQSRAWASGLMPALAAWLARAPQTLRLTPTARSALHA